MIETKYFKPASLTWWASVSPLAGGVLVASEPLHGLSGLVGTVNNLTDHASPYMLINAGLAGIGLRGAFK